MGHLSIFFLLLLLPGFLIQGSTAVWPMVKWKDGFQQSDKQEIDIANKVQAENKDRSVFSLIVKHTILENPDCVSSLDDSCGFHYRSPRRLLAADHIAIQFKADYVDPSPNTNPNQNPPLPPVP
eukprot:c14694_g1_i1 orf=430-801(-)